jgi:hypothetical protein
MDNRVEARHRPWASNPILALALLGAALVAFVASDPWFSILEDETAILSVAGSPLADTLGLFASGQGQHLHPPLSDFLLHAWLLVGGGSAQWLARLPSVLFYLAGVFTLAHVAMRLAGKAAFLPAILIGVLSPYAFHFGRLAGWYSWCFLLVALLTLAYLRYLERPSPARLAATFVCAALLVLSNYFGWAVLACVAFDSAVVRRRGTAWRWILAAFAVLALAYGPLWPVLLHGLAEESELGTDTLPLAALGLKALFNLYSVFVSESVAPWFWWASVPAALGIATVLVATVRYLPGPERAFLAYFGVLFAAMALLNIINTKRLLFVAAWLLLSVAVAVARAPPAARRSLAGVLLAIASIGWGGTISRDYYASQHFNEPWAEVAQEAVKLLDSGGVVVTNSLPLAFDMNYLMARRGEVDPSQVPGWLHHPRLLTAHSWTPDALPAGNASVLLVIGADYKLELATAAMKRWFRANCARGESRELLPDSGYELKKRFLPQVNQPRYRISLERYECASGKLPAQFL